MRAAATWTRQSNERRLFGTMAGGEPIAADLSDYTWRPDFCLELSLDRRSHASAGRDDLHDDLNAGGAVGGERRDDTPAFALFIIALVWPLQRPLKAMLPQVIAVLVTATVALLAIGVGGWLIVWGFGGIAHWVIANAARLQGLYMHAAELLERRGLYVAGLFAEHANVLWLVQVLRAIGGSLQGVLWS